MADGFEADDVIATLATEVVADAGRDVTIVTGDRDSYQLVEDPHVRVLYNKRGVSEYALYDEAGIRERTGVRPVDYVAYAAPRGDPSRQPSRRPRRRREDGCEARSTRMAGWMASFAAGLESRPPGSARTWREHEALARLNEEMMVLVRDVPLGSGHRRLGTAAGRHGAVRLLDFLEVLHELSRGARENLGPGRRRGLRWSADGLPAATGRGPGGCRGAVRRPGRRFCSRPWRALGGIDDRDGHRRRDPPPRVGPGPVWVAASHWSDGDEGWAMTRTARRPLIRSAVRPLEGSETSSGRTVPGWWPTMPSRSLRAIWGASGLDEVRRSSMDTALAAYLLDPADDRLRPGRPCWRRFTGGACPSLGRS